LRVLIIEQDQDMLELLEDVIREMGHDVTKVSRYSTAIVEAAEANFDLIIAEIGTPGVMGADILTYLRRLQPGASITAMASFGTERTARDAFKGGADWYMVKPIEMDCFRDFVGRLTTGPRRVRAAGWDYDTHITGGPRKTGIVSRCIEPTRDSEPEGGNGVQGR
jgi:DNA-binding response OmpR family regulator